MIPTNFFPVINLSIFSEKLQNIEVTITTSLYLYNCEPKKGTKGMKDYFDKKNITEQYKIIVVRNK